MTVIGVGRVRRNMKATVKDIRLKKTEVAVLSQGAALAQTMTPMDLGNLSQSQYAPGKLKGLPRPGPENRGNYWDPNAEPQFLIGAHAFGFFCWVLEVIEAQRRSLKTILMLLRWAPCGAASIRAITEPKGAGYTAENRAYWLIDLQITY